MKIPTDPSALSLRAAAVLCGHETARSLADASGAPERVVSSMLRGDAAYPKARAAVAAALGVTDEVLAAMIENSRRERAAR